jgi:hypothetical protein
MRRLDHGLVTARTNYNLAILNEGLTTKQIIVGSALTDSFGT